MIKKPNNKILITLRLKPKTLEKLDKIANEKDETRSELLRRFIENAVNNY